MKKKVGDVTLLFGLHEGLEQLKYFRWNWLVREVSQLYIVRRCEQVPENFVLLSVGTSLPLSDVSCSIVQ